VLLSKCSMNVMFVTVNLLAALLYTFLSIHPKLQEANQYRSGLLQAALVSAFTTYMVFSAIMSEPPSWNCNPFIANETSADSNGGNTTSITLGALFTILAVCYSAFNVSRNSNTLFSGDEHEEEKTALVNDGSAGGSEADEGDARPCGEDVSYSYAFFHLSFATGALYVCMLLTSWKIVDSTNSGSIADSGKVSVWVKLVSSLLTILLYCWTVVAPAILPDRDWS